MSERSIRRANERSAKRNEKRHGRTAKAALGAGAVIGATVLFAPAAQGATFTVTNLNDAGAGSLRQALIDAGATTPFDLINFQPGLSGTITLTTGQLNTYDDPVEVRGPGASVITVNGNDADRVFYVHTDDNRAQIISGLTVTGGNSGAGNDGGGFYVEDSRLELDDMVITGNTAGAEEGGGIHVDSASLTLTDSTVSGNRAGEGGGIWANDDDYYGPVMIQNTTISGNTASDRAGGVYLYRIYTGATIEDSRITGNFAVNEGGGLSLYKLYDEASFDMTGTTVSGNVAGDDGGGAYLGNEGLYGSVTIGGSTISGNTSGDNGGGISVYYLTDDGQMTIRDTTISGNTAADDGGGMFLFYADGLTRIQRSTISGNKAGTDVGDVGGGVYLYGTNEDELFSIADSTISNNSATAGGGVYRFDDPATLRNTIVADNVGGDLAEGSSTNGTFLTEFSLIEAPGAATITELTPGSDILGQDPQLGPLQANGGPTLTQAPSFASPAVDKGSSAFSRDQRGAIRPFDQAGTPNSAANSADGSDVGAVELQTPPIPPPTPQGSCKGKAATIVLGGSGQVTMGTAGADVIVGNGAKNTINGGGGNDLICGGGGVDTLSGGSGNDQILGQNGNDTLNGNAGNDKLIGGAGADKLNGATGKDKMFGQAGNDRLNGAAGNDVLNGGAANDKAIGGKGNDVLKGGAGKDTLAGSAGKDKLFGGPGKDNLSGGPGKDVQKQ